MEAPPLQRKLVAIFAADVAAYPAERLARRRGHEGLQWIQVRGRDAHCWAPPAQIRTGPIRASGSYLGCLTAKRWSGQG